MKKRTFKQRVQALEDIVLGEKARRLPTEHNLPTKRELCEEY
jgi:hypothetical protein